MAALRLEGLSIRARLFVLGGGAVVALAAVGILAITTMRTMSSKSNTSAHDTHAAQVLGLAYESWILDDDQSNMYAAVLALRDPTQHKLAEVTWGQAAAGYQGAVQQLKVLHGLLKTPKEQAMLAKIDASLASYNSFSVKLRQYGVTNQVTKAVHVMTVDNLVPSNALPTEFTNLRTVLENQSTKSAESLGSQASSATLTLILVVAFALPILLLLALLTVRSVAASLRRLLAVADRIAEGDLEDDATGGKGDEIDRAAATLRERIVGYLKPVADASRSVAAGDLTVTLEPRSEKDALGTAVAGMLDSLRNLIGELGAAGNQVAGASQGLATASDEAGRAVSEIASAVTTVSEGAGRQVEMVEQARSAAEEAAEAASQARTVAGEGIAAAEQASNAMAGVRDSSGSVSEAIESLARKSEQIGGIVETITGIAGQTNLLALNAAIEAARAGEQGRGFAVVAEEVRKLAEESQQAAASISDLVGAIQAETGRTVEAVADSARRSREGAEIVDEARQAFGQIGDQIAGIAERVQRIADSSVEIASVAEQTSATSEQVSASTQETSASTEEIAASAQQLAGTAQTLQSLVGRFTLTRD